VSRYKWRHKMAAVLESDNVLSSRECSWPSLHGYSPSKFATVEERRIDPIKNIRLFFPLVAISSSFFYDKPKAKFMHSSSRKELYKTQLHYLTRAKHDCTSA
jgi:hypothetical protein